MSDAAYMDAVRRGDMETAQRMVDAAAKRAGYNIGPVYHGTQSMKRFNKFVGTWNYRFAAEKGTTYFTNNKAVASGYGVRVVDAYLRMINPLEVDAKGQHWTIISPSALVKSKRDGNDGVIVRNVMDVPAGVPDQIADVYVTFKPSQIKSADPVTYDDAGNVISLSQRFSDQSDDIRNPKLKPDSIYTDPVMRERLKRKIMAGDRGGRPGEWSARKAQLLAAEYEKAGGGYKGGRTKAQRSLSRWTKQDWRTKSGKPSLETGERYLPAAAIGALSSAEYAASTRAKRSATGQFSRQPKRIAMKTREFRNPVTYPPEDITLSHESTPANDDIAANRKLWGTPAFKKWFGDSKVRDLAKRPMVVYHGTCASGFTKFDPTKTREMGFHFGTPPQAKDFLKGCGTYRGKNPGIYPVYLSIQKPLFTPDVFTESPTFFIEWLEKTNHIHDWFPDESDSYYKSLNRLRSQLAEAYLLIGEGSHGVRQKLFKTIWGLLRKIVMRKGYDGIRYKNENEGNSDDPSNIAWIAFSPAQVKSATENRGTFDRRDPDITNPKRSMVRSKLSRIIEPGDRILCYDTARGEDFYRLWDIIHTALPLTKEALVEVEGMLDDDGVFVIESGEEPPGLRDHFRKATRYQGLLLVQGPMNPEEARINTEKLRRELE